MFCLVIFMSDIQLRHNCGMYVNSDLHNVYNCMGSLQHRGREGAGIVGIGKNEINVVKWKDTVGSIDLKDLYKVLHPSKHFLYMGHVRYATRGRKDKILEDAHPHVIGGKVIDRGSHIIISNCDAAIVHNGQVNEKKMMDYYKDRMVSGCDSEMLLHYYKDNGIENILKNIKGSYTLAIAEKGRKDVMVIRDQKGLKPGVLGIKDGKYCVSSEDIAFLKNGAEFQEDLRPGSVYYMGLDGNCHREDIVRPNPAYCFFEWNYISHKGSTLNGVSVRRVRAELGKALYRELKIDDLDFVTYLPRCPEISARAYSDEAGVEFMPLMYKMRNERSFLGSTEDERKKSINGNLHLLPDVEDRIKGKNVLCIDDSIIRGNNSRRAIDLLKDSGVKKLYFASYTPPIGIIGKDGVPRGCSYGVDMPPDDNFIARNRNIDEISREMGVEVVYLSVKGMIKAFRKSGIEVENLCTNCIGGKDPFSSGK